MNTMANIVANGIQIDLTNSARRWLANFGDTTFLVFARVLELNHCFRKKYPNLDIIVDSNDLFAKAGKAQRQ